MLIRSTPSSQAVRSSGLFYRRSDGLEHTARRQPQRHVTVVILLWACREDSVFLVLPAHQRIRGFAIMRYINLRLTLTLMGMIIQIFVWQSPNGHCYGNRLNLGDVCNVTWNDLYSLLRHSTTDWPIINPLSKGLMTIIRLGYIVSKFGELPSNRLGV